MSSSRPLGPGDWQRINDLFHRALEQPADRRDAFLAESCGGDEGLRQEVASLLASHERGTDFMEGIPETMPGSGSRQSDVEALVGQQIGQYRIERLLG